MIYSKEKIRIMRMNIGKFLHTYYVKFGEDKYEIFVEKMGESMSQNYGDAFSSDNLRIMEVEYVTLNGNRNGKTQFNYSQTTS